MSNFGTRNGKLAAPATLRPAFGSAKPLSPPAMQLSGAHALASASASHSVPSPQDATAPQDPMARLQERSNGVVDQSALTDSFRPAIHRIKEQVLPRSLGLRPYTLEKAKQYGFEQAMLDACL